MDADEAILRAASDLVDQRGLAGMTLDEVAIRAGVHSHAVFSRWRSRHELLVELLRHHAADPREVPDTGNVADDLAVVLGHLVEGVHRLRVLIATAMAEAARDEELARELRLFVNSWQTTARDLLSREIERGVAPPGLNEQRAVDMLTSIVWFRILLVGDLSLQAAPGALVRPILQAWGYE